LKSPNMLRNRELGRRVIAALLSYRYDLTLDYTLKKYVPQNVHPSWEALGQALLQQIATEIGPAVREGLPN
jgi:hypothetical protein